MKVYARTKTIHDENCGRVPYNYNIATAIYGFHEMGFEIHLYNSLDEIYDKLEKGDIILDGIKQVEYCLKKFGIVPQECGVVPEVCADDNLGSNYGYYPEVLIPYLGRKIWKDNINHINANPETWGCFVKPVKEKRFTGRVINSPKDLVGCGSCYENYEVWCSEPVDFVMECRGFVYYDKMIDLRPYNGDFTYMKNLDTELIKKAVSEFVDSENRPLACALDWGVTKDGRTLFIEQNMFYSCAGYGLFHIDYAKMISACFSQLYGLPDECNF